MTDFLDKFKIATTKQRQRKFNFRNEHITTTDFCQLGVAQYRNLIPNERIEVNFRAFARFAPLVVPTFGRANLNVRSFFVPFRTIFPAWNDFITDAPHTTESGPVIYSSVPQVKNVDLVNVLVSNSVVVTANDAYDFSSNLDYGAATKVGALKYYKLNRTGRNYFKLLTQLGYAPTFYISDATKDYSWSALSLLAFAKVYCDWYWSSAYVGNAAFAAVEKLFKVDNGSTFVLTYGQISNILNLMAFVQYDSDYFVSAFDSPAGPSGDFMSNVTIEDTSFIGSYVKANVAASSGEPSPKLSPSSGNAQRYITQYAVDALKRLTDYMKRHQLAGSRSLDRYLARFGVQLAPEKLSRSVYLGSHKIPMMTGDVMATADTFDESDNLQTQVGDYAGKGYLAGDDGHFEFKTDEYGLFLCLYSVVPEVGYYQGVDRHNMHLSRLDFFTPEFDGMGTRAISGSEVVQPLDNVTDFSGNMSHIFGYTPQYSEYKIGRDCVSGDYRCKSISAAGLTSPAWHLFRDLEEYYSLTLPTHSLEFTRAANDAQQFERIFQFNWRDNFVIGENVDSMFLHFFFGVTSYLPAKPLYDSYDWLEEGEKVTMDVNGVKMN